MCIPTHKIVRGKKSTWTPFLLVFSFFPTQSARFTGSEKKYVCQLKTCKNTRKIQFWKSKVAEKGKAICEWQFFWKANVSHSVLSARGRWLFEWLSGWMLDHTNSTPICLTHYQSPPFALPFSLSFHLLDCLLKGTRRQPIKRGKANAMICVSHAIQFVTIVTLITI